MAKVQAAKLLTGEQNNYLEQLEPPEYHLASVNRNIRNMMNKVLRPHGLKLVEWRLLQCLADGQKMTINDLAELAVIERTVTSRLVDKLVERKLAKKSSQKNDRRVSLVVLTEVGRRKLSATDDDVHDARVQLFGGLDHQQITTLLDILKQMQANLVVDVFSARRMRNKALKTEKS